LSGQSVQGGEEKTKGDAGRERKSKGDAAGVKSEKIFDKKKRSVRRSILRIKPFIPVPEGKVRRGKTRPLEGEEEAVDQDLSKKMTKIFIAVTAKTVLKKTEENPKTVGRNVKKLIALRIKRKWRRKSRWVNREKFEGGTSPLVAEFC